jgi:glycosyltransferase involved in cell wall biosynthesis
MKKILFILERNLSTLPPMLAVIDSLIDTYNITFIVRDREEAIENLYKSKTIKFIAYNKPMVSNAKFFRGINRVRRIYFFKNHIPSIIKKEEFDLVWIATAEAAVFLGKPIEGVKYIFSIYELYDVVPKLLKKITPIAQNANAVVVPEFNRAYMLRFWLSLDSTPFIIPNKPVSVPLPSQEVPVQLQSLRDKKIVLYQGHIIKDRNLDALCEALSDMPEYVLVLMGSSLDNYLEELKANYSNILQIDFLPPPSHLQITSHAYVGIVTYDYTDLNQVYCAPNKIWEYSGYGVPMLANNIPGLIYTVGNEGAGCCIDMNNVDDIKQAVLKIDHNHDSYSKAAIKMFNSFDVKGEIQLLVQNILK